MAHLVDYEEARTQKDKALAAIEVMRRKNSKRLAWSWAKTAIDHAVAAGIADAGYLVNDGRYPDCTKLQVALEKL